MNALAGTDAFLRVGVFGRKDTILFRGCNVEIYGIRCIKKASVINAALHLLSKSYGLEFELERLDECLNFVVAAVRLCRSLLCVSQQLREESRWRKNQLWHNAKTIEQ